MSTPGSGGRRLGRREARRLLAGRPDDGRPELTRLLRAAAAPPHSDEVAGEPAAVEQFRRQYELGRTGRGPTRTPRRSRRMALAPRLAVVLAALLVAGLATGARAGILPAALQRPAHHLFGQFGVPPFSPRPANSGPASAAAGTPGSRLVSGRPSPAGSVSPAVEGWCRAYQENGNSLGAKEIAELTDAAGGAAKIPDFCTDVLGAAASRHPGGQSAHPSHPAKPSKAHGPPSPKPSKR